jgi:hypothetical protein
MAASAARPASPDEPPTQLSREAIARILVGRRASLIRQLPKRIKLARNVSSDAYEWIVDDAIDFLVTENEDGVIRGMDDLEKAFWKAAHLRVHRAWEGRYDLVRAGWTRVGVDGLEVPDEAESPEDAAISSFERGVLEEFRAALSEFEQTVLALKYSGPKVRARFHVAAVLGLKPFEVRRAERSIARKLKKFSAVVAAGRLCEERSELFEAVALGTASEEDHRIAHAHLVHCVPCRAHYKEMVRAVTSGRLQREIGQLIPAPVVEIADHRRGPWEVVWDWLSRPFAHDAAAVSQLGSAGRGLGTLAGAKLAALCLSSVIVAGGGLYCVERLGEPPKPRPTHLARKPPRHRSDLTPTPTARPVTTVVAAATTTPQTQASPRHKTRGGEVRRDSTSHEKAAAISPPATTSTGQTVSEFEPGPTSAAIRQPAAAAGAGPEFP